MDCDCCMDIRDRCQTCINKGCTYMVCEHCIDKLGTTPLCPACRNRAHYRVVVKREVPYGKIFAVLWFYGYFLFVVLFAPSLTCRNCVLPYNLFLAHVFYGIVGGVLILGAVLLLIFYTHVVQAQHTFQRQSVVYLSLQTRP